ncbi:fibrinogen-like protein 1 [Calliphora vicina]|uniref:fibrinogen-like protein 1 n=1 Tax=Calliphora vicina TaxID=7373 RepID=UPI00325B4642
MKQNSDEIEIFKHLFVKLNKILDGNELVLKDLRGIERRIQQLENKFNKIPATSTISEFNEKENLITCNSLTTTSNSESPDNYCFGDNWQIIQRRTDGAENFNRDWNDYKHGFGNKSNEFFAGLETLHRLTTDKLHELLVVLQDYDNSKRYARYDQFEIGSENEQYVLKSLGVYIGNAGDSLTYHNGSKFSTKDRDNDQHQDFNCAEKFQSGWWFRACHESNLNGCYSDANLRNPKSAVACGIHWKTFRGQWYSLKFVEIMIRPKVEL